MGRTLAPWLQAARLPSLTASAVPVLAGTAIVADERFRPLVFALALLGAMALQAGTNLVNDYYDHVQGADTGASLGPSGVIQRGQLAPRAVLFAGIAAFAVGAALGGVLVLLTDWRILPLGAASIAVGYAYTAPPFKLAYRGLGEIAVFVFMGPAVVMGAAFVQTEQWSRDAFAASLPLGLLAAAILHANNLRDIEGDRAHGKLTLAALAGRPRADLELGVLLFAPYITVPAFVATGRIPPGALLVYATLPLAMYLISRTNECTQPRELNRLLMQTVGLHLVFGLLLALGLALDAWTA
jgi:1,4-dihydroxy-2-naphthoate octaprenyltransferase